MQKITLKGAYYYKYEHLSIFVPLLASIPLFRITWMLLQEETIKMSPFAIVWISLFCLCIIILLFEYSRCKIDLSKKQITVVHFSFNRWRKTVIPITTFTHFYIGTSIHRGKTYAQLFLSSNGVETYREPLNYIKYADILQTNRIKDQLNEILGMDAGKPTMESSL